MAATKRARVERAMVTAMRVPGKEEGKEEGKGEEEEDDVATKVACDKDGDNQPTQRGGGMCCCVSGKMT